MPNIIEIIGIVAIITMYENKLLTLMLYINLSSKNMINPIMIAIKMVLKKLSFLLNLATYPDTTKQTLINKKGLKISDKKYKIISGVK